MLKCPVPGCELIPPHVPYVTDFCHGCGGGRFYKKMDGLLCTECSVFYPYSLVNKEVQNEVVSSGADVGNPPV